MKYLEIATIWILHKITQDPIENIQWELGWCKTNDAELSINSQIEIENDAELIGTGFSLIGFATGYLDWHAKIDQGWVPHKFQ